jgi:ABC-type dipeptide/oligopeptide/nickel transport system permease component
LVAGADDAERPMRVYILKRLFQIVPTVLMITFVVFVMMQSIPGDPVVALLGDAYTEEDAIKVREAYGLDRPALVQYVIWLGKLVRGDWGTSILSGRPVLSDVLVRLPVTLELIVLSMGIALLISIPAAIIGALRQNTWADYTATTIAMVGVSIPEFFIGVLLLLVFSIGLGGLLPSSGWVYLPGTCPMMVCGTSLWGNMQHVLMPALALGVGRAALLTRLLRASMLEVVRTEYVTTARAKGLSEWPVVFKHALKNALIPTVTVMGLQVGFLIGGAIVVETLFAMPGLGTFGIDAIISRDYQQVQGFALITALAFVVINLLVDLTYTFLDPRIRYA